MTSKWSRPTNILHALLDDWKTYKKIGKCIFCHVYFVDQYVILCIIVVSYKLVRFILSYKLNCIETLQYYRTKPPRWKHPPDQLSGNSGCIHSELRSLRNEKLNPGHKLFITLLVIKLIEEILHLCPFPGFPLFFQVMVFFKESFEHAVIQQDM
jgi:hypothetical protein